MSVPAHSSVNSRRKQYAEPDFYERKLAKVMERFEVESYDWNWDRHGAWVQFRFRGDLYRFEHSLEKANAHGIKLQYGSDAFAQVVLALEDLARMVERGIYELSTWVAGLKFLPPPVDIPSFLRFLGFTEIPNGPEEVKERYRTLAKQLHPDAGGNDRDFQSLKTATEQALAYFAERKGLSPEETQTQRS